MHVTHTQYLILPKPRSTALGKWNTSASAILMFSEIDECAGCVLVLEAAAIALLVPSCIVLEAAATVLLVPSCIVLEAAATVLLVPSCIVLEAAATVLLVPSCIHTERAKSQGVLRNFLICSS